MSGWNDFVSGFDDSDGVLSSVFFKRVDIIFSSQSMRSFDLPVAMSTVPYAPLVTSDFGLRVFPFILVTINSGKFSKLLFPVSWNTFACWRMFSSKFEITGFMAIGLIVSGFLILKSSRIVLVSSYVNVSTLIFVKLLHVNNMWDFSLFMQQDISDKK